jgi:hypothetical protein
MNKHPPDRQPQGEEDTMGTPNQLEHLAKIATGQQAEMLRVSKLTQELRGRSSAPRPGSRSWPERLAIVLATATLTALVVAQVASAASVAVRAAAM